MAFANFAAGLQKKGTGLFGATACGQIIEHLRSTAQQMVSLQRSVVLGTKQSSCIRQVRARAQRPGCAGLASDGRWQHSIRPRCGRGRLPALWPWPGCRRCLARVAVSMGAEPRAAERCVGCVTGYVCVCRARPRAGLPSAIDVAERALARAKAKKGGPCNRQRRGRSGVGAQRSW